MSLICWCERTKGEREKASTSSIDEFSVVLLLYSLPIRSTYLPLGTHVTHYPSIDISSRNDVTATLPIRPITGRLSYVTV